MKRALIYVDEGDTEKRRKIEKSVSNVLATYPDYVLVEADEDQISSLESQGIRVEEQEGARMIKLRAVEFDTSEEAPSPPSIRGLSAAEISRESKNYWIVQSIGPLKAEWGEKIRDLGGKVHNYIPDNAFLVEMSSQTKEKIEKLPFVNWVGLYEPSYKVSPLLMGRKKKASLSELGTLSISTETFKPAPEGKILPIYRKSLKRLRTWEERLSRPEKIVLELRLIYQRLIK
jgi:hypothetical protein